MRARGRIDAAGHLAPIGLAVGLWLVVAVGAAGIGAGCAPRAESGASARFVRDVPPPLRTGPVPPRPSASAIWIDGHWEWTGRRYAWVPGRWETNPPGRAWVAGHWRKTARGWTWVPGRWER